MPDITLEQAQISIRAALEKAESINTKMCIAVVDTGGNLKAFVRMEKAWLGSIDIAMKKAKTSRYFDMPTGEIGEMSQPGRELFNIEISNDGLITFPGGLPLTNRDDEVIGAIGVSGSTVSNDLIVAEAGETALSGHFLYSEKKV
ncbi:MAG: heme-binding protein [Victivallales bacterium]|nr:heme-binding protein [Victivallales bacterium]MCF7888593.1 heme-binding protein [Victivallales bacterium]